MFKLLYKPFGLILGGAAGAVGYYARNTYYVGFQGDSVVIFKGKPGGVLWIKPTVEERKAQHHEGNEHCEGKAEGVFEE